MAKKLDEKGIWIAEEGENEFYSPGEVFIKAKNKNDKVPEFLGGGTPKQKEFFNDNAGDLMRLIHRISQTMVEVLKCERVYLVSLGENKSMGVHFRLLPRYREDQGFLDDFDPEIKNTNDGLALMAHWRKQFLMKKGLFGKQKGKKSNPFKDLQKKHENAIDELRKALK